MTTNKNNASPHCAVIAIFFIGSFPGLNTYSQMQPILQTEPPIYIDCSVLLFCHYFTFAN